MIAEEQLILGGNRQLPLGHDADADRHRLHHRRRARGGDLFGDLRRADARRLYQRLGRGRHPGADHAHQRRRLDRPVRRRRGEAVGEPDRDRVVGLDRQPRGVGRGGEGRLRLCLVLGRGRIRGAGRDHAVAGVGADELQLERPSIRIVITGTASGHADGGLARHVRQFGERAGVRRAPDPAAADGRQRVLRDAADRHRRHGHAAHGRRRGRHRRDRHGAPLFLG